MADELEIDQEQEELRIRMEGSREALAKKIEKLEEKVTETVESAAASVAEATASVMETVETATASVTDTVDNVTNAVQGTVDTVRQSVEGTVESVKGAFDLSRQVEHHPWMAFGCAVVAGYVGERLLGRSSSREVARASLSDVHGYSGRSGSVMNGRSRESSLPIASPSADFVANGAAANGTAGASVQSHESHTGWMSHLGEALAPEISKLQGLALGVLLGSVKELAVNAVPTSIQQPLAEVIDQFTEKLGGQPVKGSLFEPNASGTSPAQPSFAYQR